MAKRPDWSRPLHRLMYKGSTADGSCATVESTRLMQFGNSFWPAKALIFESCFCVNRGCVVKKHIVAASLGAVVLTSIPAIAADMAVKAPAAAVSSYNWTGCYVGANAGWIGSRDHYTLAPSGSYLNPTGALAPPNAGGTGDFASDIAALTHSYSNDGSGGLIGGQFGCNEQAGQFVFGAEADGQWTSLKSSVSASYAAFPNVGNPGFTDTAHSETASNNLDGLFTVRGRVGYAWDRLLVYATGGLAIGDIKSDTNVSFATAAGATAYNGAVHLSSNTIDKGGWVVGGGAEYAFAPRWSFKTEFLHVDLGNVSYNSPLVAAATAGAVGAGYSWSTKIRERDEIARVGLNYKLN